MKHSDVIALLNKKSACSEATEWVESHRWTAKTLWNRCENGAWMLWIAARIGVDRKLLVRAACACARESLKYVRAGEERPRVAIETTERWTRGEATIGEVRAAADAAADAAAAASYAAAAADAAAAAAYAADAAADARKQARAESLKRSAELVRGHIPYSAIAAAAEKGSTDERG